jgi:5-formyltetrahydrofolate cyclo-ligase
MENNIAEVKRKLRADMRRQLKALQANPRLRERYIIDTMEQVRLHSDWQRAENILCYSSLPDEFDTARLIEMFRDRGKQVLLPRVVGDDLELRYYEPDKVAPGAFGILEPTEEARLFNPDEDVIQLALIPGLAFTKKGERLGRGRGYYDRLIPKIKLGCSIFGICYPFQVVQSLPTEPWDVRMDRVLYSAPYTEEQIARLYAPL